MTEEYAELCNETADMLDAKDERFEKLTDALQTARAERDAALAELAEAQAVIARHKASMANEPPCAHRIEAERLEAENARMREELEVDVDGGLPRREGGEVTERPILFSGSMVRAILGGTKTQTRRVLTVPWGKRSRALPFEPYYIVEDGKLLVDCDNWDDSHGSGDYREAASCLRCPYGAPGDRLWVRERFAPTDTNGHECKPRDAHFAVLADGAQKYRDRSLLPPLPEYQAGAFSGIRWRPSIHMPRWASRITLEVTDVRVQRVQDISEDDARAEGVEPLYAARRAPNPYAVSFACLWDSINGKRPGRAWADNPWVWRVTFRMID